MSLDRQAARPYRIRAVQFEPDHTEEVRDYTAASLGEALVMAAREDAGQRDRLYGICPEDYAIARAEGIPFNEADGLLVDGADDEPDERDIDDHDPEEHARHGAELLESLAFRNS